MQKKLDKTIIHSMKGVGAFWSVVLLSLKMQFSEDTPTACTNGKSITFNPNFFDSLTDKQKVFLVMHEVLHTALGHHLKREGVDNHPVWNAACDYVINLLLVEMDLTMPSGGLLNERYNGMTEKQVYDILIEECIEVPIDMDDLVPSEEDFEGTEAMDEILVKAVMEAERSQGSIPTTLQQRLFKLLNPKVNWEIHLAQFIDKIAGTLTESSYARPNLYYPPTILPKETVVGIPSLTVFIDTSGSVQDVDFAEFMTEVEAIREQLQPNELIVVDFGIQLNTITELQVGEPITDLHFSGKGGTDITPVIEYIEEANPTLSIIFTDGWFLLPSLYDVKAMDVLWVIKDNLTFEPDHGEVIHYG
jgi:predicted metal-dependent peptidase